RHALQGLPPPHLPRAGADPRPRGADTRRAHRRPRPEPEARGAHADPPDGREQGDRVLHPHPRGGRGGVHPRDHHRPRPHRRRRRSAGARAALTNGKARRFLPLDHAIGCREGGGVKGSWAAISTIARRELAAYFESPVAYVFLVIFLLLAGFFTFTFGGFFERGEASLAAFFNWLPWLFLFLVPAAGARPWAGGRGLGTDRLVVHLPVARCQGGRRQVPPAPPVL